MSEKKIKHIILTFCKVLFTVTIFYFLLQYTSLTNIESLFSNINITFLILACFLTFLQMPLKVLKWFLLVRIHHKEFFFKEAISSYLKGIALATVSPFAIGELARGMLIKKKGINSELTGKAVLDKIFDFITVLLFCILGLLLFLQQYTLTVAVIVAYITALYFSSKTAFFFNQRLTGSTGKIKRFLSGVNNISRKRVFLNASISFCYFIIFYAQLYLLLRAFSAHVPFSAVLLAPGATLSTIIPITISGLGIREWAAVMLLQHAGISHDVAFKAFFTQFLITNVLLAMIGGILFLISKNKPLSTE